MIEDMILDQVLEALPVITGRRVTEEWVGHAEKVAGSPDHIIGLDGLPFGIELTEIRDAEDAEDCAIEASRLALQKSQSYKRRGVFQFPIALVVYATAPPLFDMRNAVAPEDFAELGFAEIWAVDFSDAYYTPGHPFREPDLFCFKPQTWFGLHQLGGFNRKPFG